jgi:hypothetical protein
MVRLDVFISTSADEMDKKDEELRETIRKLWPLKAKKKMNLFVPPNEGLFVLIIFSID